MKKTAALVSCLADLVLFIFSSIGSCLCGVLTVVLLVTYGFVSGVSSAIGGSLPEDGVYKAFEGFTVEAEIIGLILFLVLAVFAIGSLASAIRCGSYISRGGFSKPKQRKKLKRTAIFDFVIFVLILVLYIVGRITLKDEGNEQMNFAWVVLIVPITALVSGLAKIPITKSAEPSRNVGYPPNYPPRGRGY